MGGALGRNPIMFLVPCHRVIAADGTLGGWGGDRWGDLKHRLATKRDLLLREGVTVRRRGPARLARSSAAGSSPWTLTRTPPGEPMTTAAPAPSMFAVFRKRDFSPALARPAGLDRRLVADRPRRRHLVYRETGSALAVGLTLMATAVPSLIVGLLAGVYVDRHDRKKILIVDLPGPGRDRRLIPFVIGIESIAVVGLYALILINAGVKQFFDPAQDSVIPDVASRRGAGIGQLVPVDQLVRLDGHRLRGRRPAGQHRRPRLGVLSTPATFLFSAACIALVRSLPMPIPDEEATVAVVVDNLRAGFATLVGTPIMRSAVRRRRPVFFAFGLWNVLLLPFAIKVLGATEFEYGLQEGLTSVGFVVGSLFMAKFVRPAARAGLDRHRPCSAMGVSGILYGMATRSRSRSCW